MLRSDAGIIEPGGNRMLFLDLAVVVHQQIGAIAVQHAGPAAGDRGRVLAGTATNLFDPCHPSGVATRFAATDEIWVSAVFTQRVPAFESVTIQYRRDGEYLLDAPLQAGPAGLDCYYEEEPIRDAIPGTYRITVRHGSDELSSGEFVIAP